MLKRGAGRAAARLLMLGAIVASQSRRGTVGLAAMALVLGAPAAQAQARPRHRGGASPALLALPLLPSSYWQRVASITDEDLDETGSREARSMLLQRVVRRVRRRTRSPASAPASSRTTTPRGARKRGARATTWSCRWPPSSASSGSLIFVFLVVRAVLRAAADATPAARRCDPAAARRDSAAAGRAAGSEANTRCSACTPPRCTAALAGWFVCALFASVAYHWTFYYLLALAVAPRDYLLARAGGGRVRHGARPRRAPSPPSGRTHERRRQHAAARRPPARQAAQPPAGSPPHPGRRAHAGELHDGRAGLSARCRPIRASSSTSPRAKNRRGWRRSTTRRRGRPADSPAPRRA